MTTTSRRLSLSERRRALKLSRHDLAALAECSVQSINNLEQGFIPKHSAVLVRVETALTEREAR